MRKVIVMALLTLTVCLAILCWSVDKLIDSLMQEFKYEVVTEDNKRIMVSEFVTSEWVDAPRSVGDTVYISIKTGKINNEPTIHTVAGVIKNISKNL